MLALRCHYSQKAGRIRLTRMRSLVLALARRSFGFDSQTVATKKKTSPFGEAFFLWSRWESNPRPRTVRYAIYKFSYKMNLTNGFTL